MKWVETAQGWINLSFAQSIRQYTVNDGRMRTVFYDKGGEVVGETFRAFSPADLAGDIVPAAPGAHCIELSAYNEHNDNMRPDKVSAYYHAIVAWLIEGGGTPYAQPIFYELCSLWQDFLFPQENGSFVVIECETFESLDEAKASCLHAAQEEWDAKQKVSA